ncbi:hypothetical protein CU098_012105 [Rhizopus stolonifer]|uniref:AMP-dependent synthetase/ligase domain-containing protein n=1 Tax=Rhizopus stolonifer TaxID=4846 RepID=A0A367KM15_RHIST|nr:hypothetical protein CU098_012105 [Rhizopus stolonifer]
MVVKVPKLAHEEAKGPIIYKPHFTHPNPFPSDSPVFDILFTNNKNKVDPNTRTFIDVENPNNFVTYGQLEQDILAVATGLKQVYDLQPRDVIAICCPNDINYPSVLHGIVFAGGIAAAIPHSISSYKPEEVAQDIENIKPKMVIMSRPFLEQTLPLLKKLNIPESNILIMGIEKEGEKVKNSITEHIRTVEQVFLSLSSKYTKQELLQSRYNYTEQELKESAAYFFFTSGSTGKRKAVMLTQHGMVAILANRPMDPSSEPCRILGCNKFFHISSLILALHLCVYNGDECYVCTKFELRDLCVAIEKYKINSMMALFYNISEMCNKSVADEYDISSLTVVYNMGTRLHFSAVQALKNRHGLSVIDIYGLTETLLFFKNSIEDTKVGSTGRLCPGFEVRLIDDDGNDVPRGDVGHLIIRGPTICKGYYNDPEITAATFDKDGYIFTGDLLKCDNEGRWYYVERYKDMIRYYESSIYPSTIESVMMKHPKVLECAVVGIKVPAKNIEVPRGYIRFVEDVYGLTEEQEEELKQDIIKFTADRVANEMQLRGGLFVVDSFPRTYSGKIRRYTLKVEANRKIMEEYDAQFLS